MNIIRIKKSNEKGIEIIPMKKQRLALILREDGTYVALGDDEYEIIGEIDND